jgi:hypothetical protein
MRAQLTPAVPTEIEAALKLLVNRKDELKASAATEPNGEIWQMLRNIIEHTLTGTVGLNVPRVLLPIHDLRIMYLRCKHFMLGFRSNAFNVIPGIVIVRNALFNKFRDTIMNALWSNYNVNVKIFSYRQLVACFQGFHV